MPAIVNASWWSRARAQRWLRGAIAASAVGLLTAGTLLVAPASAIAAPASLFAYPGGAAGSPTSCPQTATASAQCTLPQALALAQPGDTIELAEAGHYVGNFTLDTTGTSASTRVTLEPAAGVTDPILDGNKGATAGCSTTACNGPVLTIGPGVFAALSGITIQNADNTATGLGGGVFMGDGADMTVTGSTFTNNTAAYDGGAIDNADAGTGTLTVSNSVFTGNTASEGGAIDNADQGNNTSVDGTLIVTGSTFTKNVTTGPGEGGGGGAIASGAHPGVGTATVTVSDSTFVSNDSGSNGGAIDSEGPTALSVTTSTFSTNTAGFAGGAIAASGSSATVTASTFAGNSADFEGDAINNFGPVVVAANEFADSCSQFNTWTDNGYNVGDSTCFASSPPSTDVSDASLSTELAPQANNGGPTQTILLKAGNPGAALIPNGTSGLCLTTDQRGVTSPTGAACNAGAVQAAGTTTTVTSSVNPSTEGQSVTFTATVKPDAPATNTPTRTVQFSVDGAPLGGPVALTNGTATFHSSSLPAGPHTITAAYYGDPNDAPSASQILTQTVSTPLAASTTTVTSGTNPSLVGQPVTFTASVTSSATGTPTGTVQFTIDGTPQGSPVTVSSGAAHLTVASLGVGHHQVGAVYSGDAEFAGSTSSDLTQVVDIAPTTTTLTVPSAPVAFGSAVDLSATVVAEAPGSGTPNGTVQFAIDGHAVGGPVTLQDGRASTTATGRLAAGGHTVTADYRGSADYSASSDSKQVTIAEATTTSSAPSSSSSPAAPTTSTTTSTTISTTTPTTTSTTSSAAAPTSQVTSPGGPAVTSLASTGVDVGGPVGLGVLLLVAGFGLIAIRRRPRRGRHTS